MSWIDGVNRAKYTNAQDFEMGPMNKNVVPNNVSCIQSVVVRGNPGQGVALKSFCASERTTGCKIRIMKTEFESPAAIFDKLHECVKKYDADGQADMFAQHGVWEFPFATGNIPRKIEGRENIRAFGKTGMEASKKAGRRIVAYHSVTIHKTQSADTIIVEFELEGEIAAQGIRYRIPYIQLLKVEKGQIVLLRDYFSMDVLINVLGN